MPQRPPNDIRFPKDNMAEAGEQVDAREPFVELLLSDGFKEFIRLVVLPQIENLRGALLRTVDLDDKQRERMVASLRTIETLITEVFKRAGEPVPEWLARQFK